MTDAESSGETRESTVGGTATRLRLSELRLDWRNPRLPLRARAEDRTQRELLLAIDKLSNPLEVAQSISRHGFFESEPLIAVRERDAYVVVEGNRRLTALKGLTDAADHEALVQQTRGWQALALIDPPADLPCVVVERRDQVTPLLGFRHISGIEPWGAFAQAAYIVSLVEDDGKTLQEVSLLVGRTLTETRAMYRDHEIVRQGSDYFELDTRRVEADFGVFNAAMSVRPLRQYISAPTPANTPTEEWPLPESAKRNLSRLLMYVYGDERGRGKVIPESRALRRLGTVLGDPSGRGERTLRETGDLDEALEAVAEPEDRYRKALRAALKALRRAASDLPQEPSEDDIALLRDVETALRRLQDGSSGPR